MKIRQVQKQDTSKVQKLIAEIVRSEFDPKDQKAFSMEDILALPESYSGPKDAFFVMLEDSTKIIATCSIKDEGEGVAIIRRVFVHTRYRRKGLGEKMIRHAIRFCHDHGYRLLTIRTTSSMKAVIALFYKLGFQDRASIDLGEARIIKLTYDCHTKSA